MICFTFLKKTLDAAWRMECRGNRAGCHNMAGVRAEEAKERGLIFYFNLLATGIVAGL